MGLGDSLVGTVKSLVSDNYEPQSNLQGFLTKFTSSEGLFANVIDPLNTFDIKFEFYPLIGGGEKKNTLGKLKSMGISALKTAGNNLFGGLLGSIIRDFQGDTFKMAQESFVSAGVNKITFLEYLARGNMFKTSDDAFGSQDTAVTKPQLIMNLSYYVQDMSLPQFTQEGEGTITTMMGEFPVNGRFVKPSSNEFQMNVINTKQPLMEKLFYPWMREVTLPYWSYETQPYTTANVTVSFEKHADIKYVFVNCRPKNINSYSPSNELNSIVRNVSFIFDYVFVTSTNKVAESTMDKLLDVATGALNGVGQTLGL